MHQDKPNVWMKMTHVHKEKKKKSKNKQWEVDQENLCDIILHHGPFQNPTPTQKR